MKTVVVFSSETVFYRTEMQVADNATDDDISKQFYSMEHNEKTLEQFDSDSWQIDDIDIMENE